MKTLFLVRHSKAVTRRADLPDFQRTLVKAGEKKSTNMARKLKKEGVMPDLMISSTANRALETAHLFAKSLGYSSKNIEVKDALYSEMSPEALLYIVGQVDDNHNSIMLFGHNPAFTDFASYLIKGFVEDIPKSGIVGIQFDKNKWKDITKASGKLEFFEYPKRLAKTLKRLELELQIEIALNVQDVLDKMDPKSAKKMKKTVKRSSDRIAKDFLKLLKVERAKEEKKALAAEKAKRRKAKPKPRQKPISEPEPKSKPKAKPKPKTAPATKPRPKSRIKAKTTVKPKVKTTPVSKAKPKPRTSTKPAPKPRAKSAPASKPGTKSTRTRRATDPKRTRAEAPKAKKASTIKTARRTAVKKQTPKPKVSRTRKASPRAKAGARRA